MFEWLLELIWILGGFSKFSGLYMESLNYRYETLVELVMQVSELMGVF